MVGKGGRERHFWPQLINRTLFRLACTHYLFTGAFSQSEGNMFQHLGKEGGGRDGGERERRWDELLPGVGRCHGVPSGDSIASSSVTECQWEGVFFFSPRRNWKWFESAGARTSSHPPIPPEGECIECEPFVRRMIGRESLYTEQLPIFFLPPLGQINVFCQIEIEIGLHRSFLWWFRAEWRALPAADVTVFGYSFHVLEYQWHFIRAARMPCCRMNGLSSPPPRIPSPVSVNIRRHCWKCHNHQHTQKHLYPRSPYIPAQPQLYIFSSWIGLAGCNS